MKACKFCKSHCGNDWCHTGDNMLTKPLTEDEINEIEKLLVKSEDLGYNIKEALSKLIASHRLIYLRKKVFKQTIEKYLEE